MMGVNDVARCFTKSVDKDCVKECGREGKDSFGFQGGACWRLDFV
jgi:hypothetical protein